MVRYLDSVQNEHNMRLASFFFNQEHYVLVFACDRNAIQGSREYDVTRELPDVALVNCSISHIFTII